MPASSAVLAKVINVMYVLSSNAEDVADIIEHDPSLTANILKVANSAYYGSYSTISSLKRAVVTLGFETLKEIVYTIGSVNCFQSEGNKHVDGLSGLWLHSVGTGKVCQSISKRMNIERPDNAYLVGLLHDIGKILLLIHFPKHFHSVINLTQEKNTRFILAEQEVLNTDHTEIGGLLCDIWSLPEVISDAIICHHESDVGKKCDQELARIVVLGDYLCRTAEIGYPGDSINIRPTEETMVLLGSNKEEIEENYNALLDELSADKPKIENFFHEIES
ncbi:HDOD domain-containing protein [Candidatus Latescibacterota bacterium]